MYCNSNVDDAANCGNDGVCITYIYRFKFITGITRNR